VMKTEYEASICAYVTINGFYDYHNQMVYDDDIDSRTITILKMIIFSTLHQRIIDRD